MKKNEIRNIALLVVISIVIIAIIMIFKNGSKNNKQIAQNQQAEESIKIEKNETNTNSGGKKADDVVKTDKDVTRVNTSGKLAETKKCGNLEISNMELKEKNGETYIQATVKNNGSTAEEGTFLKLKIIDKAGNAIAEVKGYIDVVKAGETYLLKIKTSADFANAYDFTVSK